MQGQGVLMNLIYEDALMTKPVILMVLVTLMVPECVFAAKLPDGDQIAKNINARDEGVAVSRTLLMEMTDRHGKQRTRKTKAFRKYFGAEKRTVIFYLEPKNVRDTGFLTWDYPEADKDDDQWLYLPAMRKVRRISASDRGDYFLGTDLTYEDIKLETRVSIQDYKRKTIGEDEVDGHHCFIVEETPVSGEVADELGYGRVEQCVDDEIWIVRRSKFWDTNGNPLKTVQVGDIRKVQGIWTQHQIEVKNDKTGHSTKFIFSDVDYKSRVADDLFTQNSLRRGL